jgi:hypothetical protein
VASVALSTEPVPACVRQDPAEPGFESIGVAEPREVSPGSGERLVGRIFSLLGISQDQASDAVGLIEARVDERLERGDTRRVGLCRDGTDLLRQPATRFRSFLLHRYRRTTRYAHSIFVGGPFGAYPALGRD